MTDNQKWALGLGAVAVSIGGFVAFRKYVLKETVRVLREEYEYDEILTQNPKIAFAAKLMNLPTAEELAESAVPLWSFVLPETAINDILEKERASVYWPPNRQVSAALAPLDKVLFAALRAQNSEPAQIESK